MIIPYQTQQQQVPWPTRIQSNGPTTASNQQSSVQTQVIQMPVVKLEEPALVEVPKVKEQPKLPLTYLPLSSFDPCTTLTPKRQRKLREAANQNSQELLMQFLMATAPLSPGLVTNSNPFFNLFTIKHNCKACKGFSQKANGTSLSWCPHLFFTRSRKQVGV